MIATADIVILCFIALPMIIGVFYGFLNIAFSLLSWIVSFGLSVKFMPYFSPLLEQYVSELLFRNILAFVGIFILSLIIMSLLSYLIVKLLGRTGLTATDRILGLFFGLALGSFINTIIILIAGFTALPQESWWRESQLIKPFERVSVWSIGYLPESFREYHSHQSNNNIKQ